MSMGYQSDLSKVPTAEAWERIGISHHHGINLPLSALHSRHSCGIGEFFDLIPLIDWCKRARFDIIQLLPLNHSQKDPSPYNPVSSLAIHFIYLSLYKLPFFEELEGLKDKLQEMHQLNRSDRVFYEEVTAHKLRWLYSYFLQVGKKIIKSGEFQAFVKEHSWVHSYALYQTLSTHLNGISWKSWPKELQAPSQKMIESLCAEYPFDISFYSCLQYLCHLQLTTVKTYANQQGIFLMGDLSILVSSESSDVWQYPDYFNTQFTAGAPPDFYHPEGQNWGFPLFEWETLKKNHYQWWKQRLSYNEQFFDLFRIDHVIGLFRIWAIPPYHLPKEGFFIPKNEQEWGPQGKEILSMIVHSTTMLPIGEDLGIVPPVTPPTLQELGICSTKVMRWEVQQPGKYYTPIDKYPPISLTCVSTHDSETLTLWWKKFPEEAQKYASFKHWEYAEELTQTQRISLLWDSHHTSSLFHINLLQEYLAIHTELIRENPEEERINIPGTVLPSNWTYRFKPSVEEIVSHEGLFASLQTILHSPDGETR